MPHLGNERTQLFYATVLRPWLLSDVENFPEGAIGPVSGIGLAQGAGSAFGVGYQIGVEGLASGTGSAAAISATFESETTTWINAVVAAGGSVSAERQIIVNDLIAGLKADSLWTKLDRLWVFAAENTQAALRDLKTIDVASEVNSPDFAADRGYAGNGSDSYVNTTFNPSTQATQLALDSASLFVWNRTSRAAGDVIIAGVATLGNAIRLYPRDVNDEARYYVNSALGTEHSSTNSAGFWHCTRTGSASVQLFRNGSSVGTGTEASGIIPNDVMYVAAENFGGAAGYSDYEIACVGLGAGMNSTEAADLYTHINDYMTAIGA